VTKSKAIEEGLKVLDDSFSYNEVSIVIATKIHDAIKKVTQNPDPYRGMKDMEISSSKELFNDISPEHNDLRSCLRLAALGNAIDFFRPPDVTRRDMRKKVILTIDDSEHLESKLKHANKVLYLADNAGEVFFDLPLLRQMRQYVHTIYVVKASPVQNDVTLKEVRKTGREKEFGEIITTGTATPGIVFPLASEQFKQEFAAADLIFAKGMGYYESLSELPSDGRIFYCLMAKCQPVADSLHVPLNSYVAMLQ